jgi:hypothetical protein
MKTEDKTKLIIFIRKQLNHYGINSDLAWEAIFRDRDHGNRLEKLATLKFLALYSSQASPDLKQKALEVIEDDGTSIDSIDMEIMTRKE